MDIETTKMSSKGQIVVPKDIRKYLEAKEGTLFAVFSSKDTIILKKIETPSKQKLIEDLEKIAKLGRKRIERLGLKEKDIPKLVHKLRKVEK